MHIRETAFLFGLKGVSFPILHSYRINSYICNRMNYYLSYASNNDFVQLLTDMKTVHIHLFATHREFLK